MSTNFAVPGQDHLALVRAADRAEAAGWADLFAAAPAGLGLGVATIGGATVLTAPKFPLGLFNRAIGLGLDGPVAAADVDAVIDAFAAAGSTKAFIHVGAATDPSVTARLEARGVTLGEPAHWARAVHGVATEGATDLAIRPVDPTDAPALAEVICLAHQMPQMLRGWVAGLVGRPGWRAYGAFDGDRLLAGAFLWLGPEGAWLGLGGTLPEARRRGAQGALLRRRIADAKAAGARIITTETWVPGAGGHNSSLANMLRAGFVDIDHRANYQLGVR